MKATRLLGLPFLVVFSFLLATCEPALAATVSSAFTVSWDIPITRADGAALPVSELAGYEIYYSVDGASVVTVPVAGGATKTAGITLNLSTRATPYSVKFWMIAIDTGGLKSAASTAITASVAVQNALPSPPGNQKIDLKCDKGICSLTIQAAN